VRPPIGLQEHLIGYPLITASASAGLASLCQPQPQIGVELISRGRNRLIPNGGVVTIANERTDPERRMTWASPEPHLRLHPGGRPEWPA
jgi:hypothetical protein